MSSCQLALSSHASPSATQCTRTPIHASFSPTSDTLAVLWESGYVELWLLKTRLEGGGGKVMDPSRSWSGEANGDLVKNCRQICLYSSDAVGTLSTVAILSTGRQNDVVTILEVENNKTVPSITSVELSGRNCRLVAAANQAITCQDPSGEISQCLSSDSDTSDQLNSPSRSS